MNRFGRALAMVVMTAVGFISFAQVAGAEEPLLVASDPYEHQELDSPPSGVVLAFERAVDASVAQIVVTDKRGNNVNINSLIVEGTNVTAQVKPNLPKGTYTVHYQVKRSDGQVEGGAFQFSYGAGEWTSLPDKRWSGNSAQPTVLASPVVTTSTALPTPDATESATPTPTASEPASAIPSPSATPVAPDAGSYGLWAGALAVGLVLVVALGVVLNVIRRRAAPKE